jgi:hypothetical protein
VKIFEDVSEEDQFRTGTGMKDAIVMLKLLSQRNLEIAEELYACLIDLLKASVSTGPN